MWRYHKYEVVTEGSCWLFCRRYPYPHGAHQLERAMRPHLQSVRAELMVVTTVRQAEFTVVECERCGEVMVREKA